MSRLRSFSFPRIASSKREDDRNHQQTMSGASGSPYHFSPAHSRDSSGASSASTPVTPTSSARSHSHWPSSSSSLATTPDSPVNLTKSPLHDLVEEPAEIEREDESDDVFPTEEPLCICDTFLCEHRQSSGERATIVATSPYPEWTPGDDNVADFETASHRFSRQQRQSRELSSESLAKFRSRRWPSMSKRWDNAKPTTAISNPPVRSAPPSRSSSMRLPGLKRSLANQLETRNALTPPFTPSEVEYQEDISRQRACTSPLGITVPSVEDPIDRQDLASTPLLPPMFKDAYGRPREDVQSPLQSPSIAARSEPQSALHTPVSAATVPGTTSPPLSSRPSMSSFGMTCSGNLASLSEVPAMSINGGEDDRWAAKLGHANFQVLPEPYFPEQCDRRSCRQLREDWEAARIDYMRQARQIKDSYGPTSQVLKLTEQKWAEIDATWRANHQMANAEASKSGEDMVFQPLAQTGPLTKMPSLNSPQQPSKFPSIDEADIVGPMVQYAKVQRPASRKPTILRLFTDPGSLLGRGPFGLRH